MEYLFVYAPGVAQYIIWHTLWNQMGVQESIKYLFTFAFWVVEYYAGQNATTAPPTHNVYFCKLVLK